MIGSVSLTESQATIETDLGNESTGSLGGVERVIDHDILSLTPNTK